MAAGGSSLAEARPDPASVTRTTIRGTFPLLQAEPLIFLVKCLCPPSGLLGDFVEWDRVFNMPPDSRLRSTILLRTLLYQTTAKLPVSLLYLGLPDRRVPRPCERRSVTTVAIGREADEVLALLGCPFAYEYLRKGMRCRTRNGITIEIFTVESFQEKHNVRSATPLVSGDDKHAVIELTSDDSATPEELETLMRSLSPHIHLYSHPKR